LRIGTPWRDEEEAVAAGKVVAAGARVAAVVVGVKAAAAAIVVVAGAKAGAAHHRPAVVAPGSPLLPLQGRPRAPRRMGLEVERLLLFLRGSCSPGDRLVAGIGIRFMGPGEC
jgi:hypothetical protein